ncbi:unnamed protein product, partial [Gongylonema pulchrum]|uniref:MHYT domain-containing protein n=1 Tax=Gongylonema pulchrum TaxID=637853 RepID=A0A183E655_9BILA
MLFRNRQWRFHACTLRNDVLAVVLAANGLFFVAGGLYLCRGRGRAKQTACSLIASTMSYGGAIVATLLNIHRINTHTSATTIDAIVDSWMKAEPGSSLLTATLGTIITAICAYLYIVTGKRDHTVMQTIRRRRLMQTAMMSS